VCLRLIAIYESLCTPSLCVKKIERTPGMDEKETQKEKQETIEQTSSSKGDSEKKGWLSPVYSESQITAIDPKKFVENRCVCVFRDAPETDFYKILRTQIQQRTKGKGWNTVMITSVQPGEGKTLTSINLAITFAKEFHQTVLLVDGDLKRQCVHEYMGFSSKRGLIDYILDDVPLKDLIIWPGIEKLTVISGGRTIRDSSELLGCPRMAELVVDMKNRYPNRYVFFDAPPILIGADAIAFAPLVDAIIMVVEAGRTSIQDVKKALELIPHDKFLGFVLNRHTIPMRYYGSAYQRK
jgi:protein-tyrosine kinase